MTPLNSFLNHSSMLIDNLNDIKNELDQMQKAHLELNLDFTIYNL